MSTYINTYVTKSVPEAVEHAKFLASETRFSGMWVGDSHQLWTDPYVTLGACAAHTEDLRLGVSVTNPVSRHPTVTANSISCVSQLTTADVDLGIGIGNSAVYSIGEKPTTMTELRSVIEDLRSLLSDRSVTYDDTGFQLDVDRGSVNIYMAASGPRTLQLAGAIADNVIVGGGGNPDIVEEHILGNIAKGMDEAGRTDSEITVCMNLAAGTASTRREAVDLVRPVVESMGAIHLRHNKRYVPERLHDSIDEMIRSHDMKEHIAPDAAAAKQLSAETASFLAERLAIAGTPEHCQRRLKALEEAGVDQFNLSFPASSTPDSVARFNDEVLAPVSDEAA